MLEDVRKPVQNVSELTDLTLDDYKTIRTTVKTALNFKDSIGKVSSIFKRFKNDDEDESSD